VRLALVLGAGGLFAAWEAGVWKALHGRIDLSMVVGASAGAWNGWLIAAGASPDELAEAGRVLLPARRGAGIHAKACEIFERYRPKVPYGLTVTSIPLLRQHLVQGNAITWRHLAATSSLPVLYPPVTIDGSWFIDGGVGGAVPLWAAEEMGATRCIAVNCLNTWPFRTLRKVIRPRRPSAALHVNLIEPSEPLGSLRDTGVWSADNVRRWIDLGERDGNRALHSITM
jgi:NTE family protein